MELLGPTARAEMRVRTLQSQRWARGVVACQGHLDTRDCLLACPCVCCFFSDTQGCSMVAVCVAGGHHLHYYYY